MGNCIGESLPEQIARYILEQIIAGTLKSGEKIIEEKISSALQVSRAPVREALYLLQIDGIVERIPRKGTVVKVFCQEELKEVSLIMTGLVQRAVDVAEEKWDSAHSQTWIIHQEELQHEYEKKEIVGYTENVEKILRCLFLMTESNVLLKYFHETNYILSVFSRTRWTVEVLEAFHQDFIIFCQAVLTSDTKKAKMHIKKALEQGMH